jgi:prepilin-type processing-associated H-X9-DG protein
VNNLLQISVALQNYESSFEMLPPGVVNPTGPISNTPKGYHMSWITQILPYVEQGNAFKKLNFNAGAYDPVNSTVRGHQMSLFFCPSDSGPPGTGGVALNSYAACHNDVEAPIDANNKGVFYLNSHTRFDDITDGSSYTIFVSEKFRSAAELGWISGTGSTLRNTGSPLNSTPMKATAAADDEDAGGDGGGATDLGSPLYVGGFSSRHAGGVNAAFGDGSVRFLRNTVSSQVLRRLGNRADGELIGSDQF